MKIVILTQYFPPEVGAPQNRLFELAVRLAQRGHEISVFTAMPNYPAMKIQEAYLGKWFCSEEMHGLKVYRSWIWVSDAKGIGSRLLNYFSFVFSSGIWGALKMKSSDVLICESPPLFLGMTARWLSLIKRTPLLFNVSDLWPESAEKLGLVKNKLLLFLTVRLEESIYRASKIITGQTRGIVSNIAARMPNKPVYWLPNGVEPAHFNPHASYRNWRKEKGFAEEDVLFLYAGIIGHAQGLDVILDAAVRTGAEAKIKWLLMGAGPVKEHLEYRVTKENISNVFFYDVVPKSEIAVVLSSCDVAVVPLRKLDLFTGAIPSKIFENLAMEKPLLLGVEGEAKKLFIDEAGAGIFFEPENAQSLASAAIALTKNHHLRAEMGKRGRKFVEEHFSRELIAQRFESFMKEQLGIKTG